MKCVSREDGQVLRVSDDEAADLVKQGWSYCPKNKYRAFIRNKHSDSMPS